MELREKIVRVAFAKKDVTPLLSHLRAIAPGSDEIDMLAWLLKRCCLSLFEYPIAEGEPPMPALFWMDWNRHFTIGVQGIAAA